MLERKHKGILSLNLKKLASRVDDLKITLILQNEMLLLCFFVSVFLNKGKTYQDMVKLYIIPFWGQYVPIFSVKIACSKLF